MVHNYNRQTLPVRANRQRRAHQNTNSSMKGLIEKEERIMLRIDSSIPPGCFESLTGVLVAAELLLPE